VRHRPSSQRKICLQDFEEHKRDMRLPFGKRDWLRGLDLNQRSGSCRIMSGPSANQ